MRSTSVLYQRSEAALYRSARIHFRGRRGALRQMVRRYLKPHRRDGAFLRGLTSSVTRVLVAALLMLQTWATEVEAQPSFSSSSPANAAKSISQSSNLSATFSEAIAGGTVSSSTFVVHGGFVGQHSTGGTASTHRDGTYTGGGTTTLTFDPGINFKAGELVDVSLTTGLQNGSAQALTAARVYRFRAAAGTGPGVFANVSSDVDTPTNDTRSASLGDLDGDGDLDLVTGNSSSQVNRVYLSNGNGTFASGSDVDTPTNNTLSLSLGDVDGDGDLDLVTGNGPQVNRVYLGNGNGTFVSGNDVAATIKTTRSVSLGDVDGDGDLDLTTGNYGQGNRVYLGNGNGTFASGSDIDTPTNLTIAVSLGDVDGDGDLDLVVGNNNQVNRVYLGNGNGTFSSGSDIDTPTNATRAVSLGDVDGDGDLDLVTGNYNQADRLYLGNGNGTFASGSDIATPTDNTLSVLLGDLDGDGDLDLVMGNTGQVNRTYLGNGNNTFASGSGAATQTNQTQTMSLGDLDGDGDLDLATGNSAQVNRVYINNGATFASSSPTANNKSATTSSNVSATFNQSMNAASSSTFVVHGSMTGKRSGSYSGTSSTTLSFDPSGDFRAGEQVEVSLTTSLQTTGSEALYPARVFRFTAAASTGPAVFSNASHDLSTATNSTYGVSLGDLDGDGDLDLVIGNTSQVNRVYLGGGNGLFASGSDVDTPTNATRSVPLGDLDGDGDLDLVAGNSSQVNRVYLGNGNGTFASGNDVDTPTNGTQDVQLGDLDGDGDLDMIAGNYGQPNRVYLSNGNGTFASGNDVDTPANKTYMAPLGDLDLDGDLDLVTGNFGEVNRVYLSDGDGTFAAGNDIDTPTNSTVGMALGDLDGDGDLDLVIGNHNQVNRLYLGTGSGTFTSGSNIDTPTNETRLVALGDVDGDGDLDLAVSNYNQVNRLYLGNGNGTFASGSDIDTPTNRTWRLTLGDVDGDSDLDLIAGNLGDVNRVYLNSNTSFSSSSPTANNKSVATSSNVSATFNKAMNAATSSTFVVHGSMSGKRAGSYSGGSSSTLTFDPSSDFKPNELVEVSLKAGLQATVGDALQPARVFQFKAAASAGLAVFSHVSNDVDTPTNDTRSMSMGDVDGDGDLDIVAGNDYQVNRIYLGNGNGTFASGNNVDTPTNRTFAMSLGDLDGDGDLDLVTGNRNQVNRVYSGNGNGTFASGSDIDTPTNDTYALSLGDLDGDGDLDLVTGNNFQVNRVYLGAGNGAFASGSDVDTPTNRTISIALGDVDGDGDLDLVTGNQNQANRVYLGTGIGTFASGSDVDTPTNSTQTVALGDVDGDGDLDIAIGNYSQVNRVYLGNGNGTFASGSDVDTPTNQTLSAMLGDIDGDGDLDIVIGNENQVNRLYLGNGNGTFAAGSNVDASTNNTRVVSLGDVDGDGDLDIVEANRDETNRVYHNSGNKDGTLTASSTLDESSAITLPPTADTVGEAVDLFDFTLTDGGGGDGLALSASQLVVNTSGTGPFAKVNWLLNGPDASNVSGTYSSGTNTITFSSLSISVAEGSNETYTLRGYFNDSTSLTAGETFSFSIDGDTDLTTSYTGTSMSGSNATVSNAAAAVVGVNTIRLTFTTQPAPLSLTSGTQLDFTTDPVVTVQDTNGVTETGFSGVVTLAETGAGTASFSNATATVVNGVATFSGLLLNYAATADHESLALTALASGAASATSNSLTADVVATKLAFTTQPAPLSLTSGVPLDFTTDPVVAAQDANGVTDTDFASAVTLSENGAGTSSFSNNTATPVNGVATFGGLLLTYEASNTSSFGLTAAASGVAGATSSSIAVSGTTQASGSGASGTTQASSPGASISGGSAPFIDVQQTLLLSEGETITITNGSLRVLDDDTLPQHIVYSTVSPPEHGSLSLGGFTQDDIDQGRLRYRHGGGEHLVDEFSFTVDDGTGGGLGTQVLTFQISPVNDAPVAPVLDTPRVDEGQLLVLALGATDPEGDALSRVVSGLPEGARLEGTTLKWQPTYAQAGRYPLVVDYQDEHGAKSRLRTAIEVREVPVPALLPAPSALDFGAAAEGAVVERTFAVRNPTAFPLVIERFSSSSKAFAVVAPALPLALAAGQRVVLTTLFAARRTTAAVQQALLTGTTNRGLVQVPVMGRSLWRGLATKVDAVDFGPRVLGFAPWQRVRVSNPGNLLLEVGVELLADGPFRVEPLALSLAGGATEELRVFYTPQTVGDHEQTLVLRGGEQRADIVLRGRGTAPKEGRVTIDFNLAVANQQQRALGSVQPGAIVDLQLHVQRVNQIAGWAARIDYDPQALSYVAESFAPGALLSELTPLEHLGAGYVEIGGDVLDRADPATGSGILGTLSFRVEEGFAEAAELAVTRLIWHRAGNGGPARDIVYAPAMIRRAPVALVPPGDFDGNGRIDVDDFLLFADRFQRRVPPVEPRFDLDDDGQVHFSDFFILADLFGDETTK